MTCQARRGPDGQTHCAACRTVCDADDEMECPLSALSNWEDERPAPYASGLAPDIFGPRNNLR